MSADTDLFLAQRNARLRAWQAHGVPVEGGWRLASSRPRAYGHLVIGCAVCGIERSGTYSLHEIQPESYYHREIKEVRALSEGWRACSHLTPLLDEDPPEVVALTRLELLAGEPPR
jgi:hypothetical protein